MATTKVSTKLLETVGVAEGGTGATSVGAARTSLGLGTVATLNTGTANGNVPLLDSTGLPAIDGSQLTGISTGATNAEVANIMLNAFRINVNGGLTVQNMVDGVVDEFEDATGIDASTSTNESYNTTSDFYGPTGGIDNDAFPTMTDYTVPSGTVSANADQINPAWEALDDAVDSNSNWQPTSGTAFPCWIAYDFGYGIVATGKYTITALYTATENPKDWTLDGWTGSAWVTLHTVTGETSWGQAEKRAFLFTNTTSYNKYRIHITANNGSGYNGMIEWELMAGPTNMTLFSNAATALAAPDDANIVIWQEDDDAITLNTDLKAYASRNGGTTYTQITLAEVVALAGDNRILTGTVDISGQSSATAMKYKIETLNAKSQRIHAVALQWS